MRRNDDLRCSTTSLLESEGSIIRCLVFNFVAAQKAVHDPVCVQF